MDKKTLEKIIQTKSVKFTLQEIEQLMDSELEKPADEMDTELVDMCLEILNAKADMKQPKKTVPKFKLVSFKKILVAAVLIAVFVVLSLPATADKYNIDVSNFTIVEKIGNAFKITILDEKDFDFTTAYPGVDLSEKTLPDFLFDENCAITDLKSEISGGDAHIKIEFELKDSKMSGIVNVVVYEETKTGSRDEWYVSLNYSQIKEINLNNIRMFIFSNDQDSMIIYQIEKMKFNLNLFGCSFDKAIEIAKTIG